MAIIWPFLASLVTILVVATTVMLTLGIGRTRRLLTHVGRWCGAFFALSGYLQGVGEVQNMAIFDQIGQTWQACQRYKVVQKGPKGTKMVNLSVFDHLGPSWAHLDPCLTREGKKGPTPPSHMCQESSGATDP